MKNAILYVAIIIGVIVLAFSVYSITQSEYQYSEQNYQRAMQSQLEDKCATPSGYTDTQWKQHMSHHPDMYTECLSK